MVFLWSILWIAIDCHSKNHAKTISLVERISKSPLFLLISTWIAHEKSMEIWVSEPLQLRVVHMVPCAMQAAAREVGLHRLLVF